MTTVRTVATHEIVSASFPRAVTDRDELARATGKAIDAALARYSHLASRGGRPGLASLAAFGRTEFEDLCRDADLRPSEDERAEAERALAGVLRAFRGSALFGLERPRSRLILVDEIAGVYAQPDYWDRRSTFYEMKSYRAIPPPPDVALQMAIFHLAFPGLRGVLAAFDRHADPVAVLIADVPPPDEGERTGLLTRARAFALEHGTEKVLEYVDVPVVRYSLRTDPPGGR